MSELQTTELAAGREMDVLVAELLGGPTIYPEWYWFRNTNDGLPDMPYVPGQEPLLCDIPETRFSTSHAAAMEVVEKLKQTMTLGFQPNEDGQLQWDCSFGQDDTEQNPTCNYADTAPLAICRAALKAKGV